MGVSVWKQLRGMAAATLFVAAGAAMPAAAELGETVTNVAQLAYDQSGVSFEVETNPATFIIEAARTPSTIEFFRLAPADPNAFVTQLNGSQFSVSGSITGDDFENIDPSSAIMAREIAGEADMIAPAETYLAGELIVVRVTDLGQNGDPALIETVTVTLTSDAGDTIALRLFESGPDTGQFLAFVPSTVEQTPANDGRLTTPNGAALTATYIDIFDSTEISLDTALVDPFGRLFNSLTGELIDGAQVSIVDAVTGAPAPVFGVDAVSPYPSTLVTGSVVTDASGLEYPLGPGEFLFPLMPPGDYRLEISPPEGFTAPSNRAPETFTDLDNAPFEIIDASFGGSFSLDLTGPLNFDVPLDPAGELVVTKTAGTEVAAVGDFVRFEIEVENRGERGAIFDLVDVLPAGFRFRAGSVRLDGVRAADPVVAPDGVTLQFKQQAVLAGERLRVSYVTEFGAGAGLGEAVNVAFAVSPTGEVISNRGEAAVILQEALLRSALTIVGRVAENACDPDDPWVRERQDGIGVPGVRLYLETGEFTVTDDDGLYHFEAIVPGTHVVQVDQETLPEGYEVVVCEENTQYAGRAFSRFVEGVGGSIQRANFYLEYTGEGAAEPAVEEAAATAADDEPQYDRAWLDAQPPGAVAWAYPDPDKTPASPSVDFGVSHPAQGALAVTLNGEPVPAANYEGRIQSTDQSMALSRWRGVDIQRGRNEFVVAIDGVDVLTREIWFVDRAVRAAQVADQSILVADGRTNPSIAVRLEDAGGRPVHAGRLVEVNIEAPYRLRDAGDFETADPVTAARSARTSVAVGENGIARIELEPTLQTGRVRLRVTLDSGEEEITAFLEPEKRDWILVGLAEGTLGVTDLGGAAIEDPETILDEDGRIAFFAKGVVRGDWLLTIAVDTAVGRGDADGDIFEDIDPNAFYTLYGDRSFQDHDAESRFPVFVRIERRTFQALFGDYDTDLTDTTLGRYSRRLSGVKTVYETDRVSVNAFAAETNQGFQKDEFAADGTSGPFELTVAPLLRNSEEIFVETRDRFRPDVIVATQPLARFVDYDIDFDTGEVIFRQPIPATDASFNPNVIVADYETSETVDRDIVAGGRAAARFADGRVEIGATYIRQEGDETEEDTVSDLAGVDLTIQIDRNTELHAEYATSRTETEEVGDDERSEAILVEVVRRTERVQASAYFREDEDGFGLGQQTSATLGARRYGAATTVQLGDVSGIAAEGRSRAFVDSEIYREENLNTGDTRTVAEASVGQDGQLFGISAGVRNVVEDFNATGDQRTSLAAIASVRGTIPRFGLNVTASHEQPLGARDESSLFPQRTVIGVDKTLTRFATLNVRHEILDGADASGRNTIAGVTVRPWTGAEVRAATDFATTDSGRRIGATVGVDQNIRINENWSAGFGVARRIGIDNDDAPLDVAPDAALSPLETAPQSPLTLDDGFTSLTTGLGYQTRGTSTSARFEFRDSALGQRFTGVLGGARQASETLSFAAAARLQRETFTIEGAEARRDIDARLGLAYRPRGEGVIIFNRLDVKAEEVFNTTQQYRIVNNFSANILPTDKIELAVFYGAKFTDATFDGDQFQSFAQLFGGEFRHDVRPWLDVGVQGSVLHSATTDTLDYSYGPSLGATPATNFYVRLGWNLEGFVDRDFEAAEFTREGPFVKLRIKFDQDTVGELLRRVTPNGP